MEIIKKFVLALIIVMSLSMCKKEEMPESSIGETVFSIEGELDRQELIFTAGKEGYYMYSEFSNPPSASEFGSYSGKLIYKADQESKESIEIIISNSTPGDLSLLSLNEILFKTSLDYKEQVLPIDSLFEVVFHPQSNKAIKSFLWDFGDGNYSAAESPTHQYQNINIEKYQVCLSVIYVDDCSDEICSNVFMPISPCNAKIVAESIDSANNIFQFSSVQKGQAPFTYNWKIGSSFYTDSVVIHEYADTSLNINSIDSSSLSLIDANNCTSNVALNVSIFNLPEICMINFEYDEGFIPIPPSDPPDSYVTIVYRSESGIEYSSFNGLQSDGSFFNIIESENYLKNERNQSTKSITVNFNCELFDIDGNKLELKNASGKIAIAHP